MKRQLFSTVTLCCGGLLSLSGCSNRAPAPVENFVFALPASVEFRRVAEGARKEAVVRLINKGPKSVDVSSVVVSCGCTSATIASGELKPGQAVALRVGYNSKGFSGSEEKMVNIGFRDGSRELSIPVRAMVYSLVKLSPQKIDFGNARLGQSKTVTVEMKRPDGGKLPTPHFAKSGEFSIQTVRRTDSQIKLQVTFKARALAGPRFASLPLQTGLEALPQTEIPVQAVVEGQCQITPPQVNFGVVQGGAEKTVKISGRNNAPLPALRIETVPKGFAVALRRQGKCCFLVARSGQTASAVVVNDAIVLRTNDAKEPSIRIPVLALVNR